jgi:hypothetical protein
MSADEKKGHVHSFEVRAFGRQTIWRPICYDGDSITEYEMRPINEDGLTLTGEADLRSGKQPAWNVIMRFVYGGEQGLGNRSAHMEATGVSEPDQGLSKIIQEVAGRLRMEVSHKSVSMANFVTERE